MKTTIQLSLSNILMSFVVSVEKQKETSTEGSDRSAKKKIGEFCELDLLWHTTQHVRAVESFVQYTLMFDCHCNNKLSSAERQEERLKNNNRDLSFVSCQHQSSSQHKFDHFCKLRVSVFPV